MSETHDKMKKMNQSKKMADRYKTPERENQYLRDRADYERSSRRDEDDRRRTERLFDWGN